MSIVVPNIIFIETQTTGNDNFMYSFRQMVRIRSLMFVENITQYDAILFMWKIYRNRYFYEMRHNWTGLIEF